MWENFAHFGFQKISQYLSARHTIQHYTVVILVSNRPLLNDSCLSIFLTKTCKWAHRIYLTLSELAVDGPSFWKSFLHTWAMIPAAKASPSTLIIVRNRSLMKKDAWDWLYFCCGIQVVVLMQYVSVGVLTGSSRWLQWVRCHLEANPRR